MTSSASLKPLAMILPGLALAILVIGCPIYDLGLRLAA